MPRGLDHYCATCRRSLTRRRTISTDVTVFEHNRLDPDDHQPVPVPLIEFDSVHAHCDFCSAEGPQWAYKLVSIQSGNMNLGEWWCACERCAVQVDARNLRGLIARVARSYPPRQRSGVFQAVLPVYTALLRHPIEKHIMHTAALVDTAEAVRLEEL